MAAPQRLFLSYARGDDEPFVKRLYEDLTARGFNVWWDRVSMPSRGLTFPQEIRDTIEACDRLLAVIGPRAVKSDYVTSEWQHGILFAKGVVPIMRLGERKLLPLELRKLHCPDFRKKRPYEEALDELLRLLAEPVVPVLPPPTSVPALPPHFLPRYAEIQGLRDKILADIQRPTVVTSARQTTGLWGIGGIGKSVLAAALARSTDTRRAFYDGIFWVTIGMEGNGKKYDPLASMKAVGLALGDQEMEHYLEIPTAQNRLAQVLAPKVCLLILDDIWELGQVTPFRNALGPRGRLLITTRQRHLVSNLEAQEHCLDVLSGMEARSLLSGWCNLTPEELPLEAAGVVEECGNLPLALAICGALARKGEVWGDILQDLKNADLSALRVQLPDYPYDSAYKAMHVSVAYLERQDPQGAEHYRELVLFPEDATTPEAAILTLWTGSNGLTEREGRRLLVTLSDLGLIDLTGKAPQRQMSMHDLQHDYLRALAGEGLPALHDRFLAAYREKCKDGWPTGPNDGYFYENLAFHLVSAGRQEELRHLLLSFEWLQASVDARNLPSVHRDFDLLPEDKDLRLVQGALRLSGQVLDRDPAELAGQLTGRLLSHESPAMKDLLKDIREKAPGPWLRPLIPNLISPGTDLQSVLWGHKGWVLALALTGEGRRVVSGSYDKTMKVWDPETGQELHTLKGHEKEVTALALTPDGRWVVCGYMDGILQVWNLAQGECTQTIRGHAGGRKGFEGWVRAVALTPDGRRAVSASDDHTIKVWDLGTGKELQTLKGHEVEWFRALALTPDGRRAVAASYSSTYEGTLSVWDLERDGEPKTLRGHEKRVEAVAITQDGRRVVSGSDTIKVWDLETGKELQTLEGLERPVRALAMTPDGHRAVSGSEDGTLKVWDLEIGGAPRTLKAYEHEVTALAITPDGRRAVSASYDEPLKVWDLEEGGKLQIPRNYQGKVTAVALTPDGRWFVAGSYDKTLKVWDLETGEEQYTLESHEEGETALAITPEGCLAVRALSRDSKGDWDFTLEVWDLETGKKLYTLRGHHYFIKVALTLDGHRAVSSDGDGVKVWDLETGEELHTLDHETLDHETKIKALALTPDGRRAVSASDIGLLKVWDPETGKEVQTLGKELQTLGDMDWVKVVALTPDGSRTVSASGTGILRVWDLEKGGGPRILRGHEGLQTVALTPDGRQAVSGHWDKTIKVWDLERKVCLTTFTGESPMMACVMDRKRPTFVVLDWDGQIHFLSLEGV